MKPIVFLRLTIALGLSLLPIDVFGQNSITPSGTPGATMKSLDQIEARTPISSLPFSITTGGSYYFTDNLTGSAGITVSADNVTIDLNGFALIGSANNEVIAGIYVTMSGSQGFCVRNGEIRGWNGRGIDGYAAGRAIYEKLRITNNKGIGLSAGFGSVIKTCAVADQLGTTGSGIQTQGACSIVDCNSNNNAQDGIDTGSSNTIINTAADNNSGNGIATSTGCRVANCASGQNGKSGIVVDTGSAVDGCVTRGNGIYGITFTSNCSVSNNTCSGNNAVGTNTNAGIFTTGNNNSIDSNCSTSNGNGIGIATPSTGSHNIIIRNRCSGNGGGNYQVGASAYGPVIDMSAGGQISSSSGTVNPWTNWIY